jgi:hypothetical protein
MIVKRRHSILVFVEHSVERIAEEVAFIIDAASIHWIPSTVVTLYEERKVVPVNQGASLHIYGKHINVLQINRTFLKVAIICLKATLKIQICQL